MCRWAERGTDTRNPVITNCFDMFSYAPQNVSRKSFSHRSGKVPSSLVLITLCFHGPKRTRGRNEFQTTSWATFSHSYIFGAQWIEHPDLQQVVVRKGVKRADSNRSRTQVNVPMWALFFHTFCSIHATICSFGIVRWSAQVPALAVPKGLA